MNLFLKIENKERWKDLLEKALFKTFFHSLEWEEFLEKNFDWLIFERYLYKDQLLLTLGRYKVFGKERLISHPFCEYGGPLPLKDGIDGREFKKDLLLNFKEPFKISFHPQIPKYFKEFGLKEPDSSRDTYFIEDIDQKNEEEIYSSFRKTLRHSIKEAKKQNLEIKVCDNEEELRFFYNLYLKTIKRHKTIPYPFSFFQYFLNSKNAQIVLAKSNKKIIAGSVFLFYDKFLHYFLNASDQDYKEKRANYLILWNQVRSYIGKNYQIFDLGGTRRGSGLEIFKKGWGTKRYPIFEIKDFPESKLPSSRMRSLLSLFPCSFLEIMSPHLIKYKL